MTARTIPVPTRLMDAIQGEVILLSASQCELWGVPQGTVRVYSPNATFGGTEGLAQVRPQRRHTNGFQGRVKFFAVTPTELKRLMAYYDTSNNKRSASQTAKAIELAAASAKKLQEQAGIKGNKMQCVTKLIDLVDEDF